MLQDPTDEYIRTITAHCDLTGKEVLEVGCGTGRITRDLARHALRVVAVDPDEAALAKARSAVPAPNVRFLPMPDGILDFPPASFDVVIYTLSLHHVPLDRMNESLRAAAGLLRDGGVIVVVEPGDGGSFTEAKERFGAGSGDERPGREAAIRAMHGLCGWIVGETIIFKVQFLFADEDDFIATKLPGFGQKPEDYRREVREFLARYRVPEGVVLDAGRRVNVLRRDVAYSSHKHCKFGLTLRVCNDMFPP
ncbi:methyltransferase domain-containing protein [Geobacter hydrogenophilus]|uniref:SAM-dependent methyltransferase n=1 Tax=Geobacter hydrogenophilus TaxID=40983 RepID=A0A9W6FZ65_9BACT|nr:class I SAM-dependent methyltransferase [Geobacter hydrogenophilus]MBT0894700.1 methyltransferase domain-containing protein [Geobacter hydrogenophilus]GLI37463.1 SAM-dependent methyltransferase [Geobacter hydrogenophilus]